MARISKKELQAELNKLITEESAFDNDLRQYFSALADGKSPQSLSKSFNSADMSNNIRKIEEFSPCFEAMIQDSKKLANQVEDCRSLSDRLSIIVRRLDIMQIRAQQALACAEDVMNLKEFKSRIIVAMEQENLPLAVSIIRQVHDIDLQAAKASDDYGAIQQAEREVKIMVQNEFNKSIEENNINKVMSLCPLLQTLSLEEEARDTFLAFVEKTVFIAVSADASAVDDATDPATGYAQALSNVFNSTYMILQRHLPMVIQGMENSLGDIHFIRRLHSKCEQECGLVLKRYMKFRHIKMTMSNMKNQNNNVKQILPSEIHVILDELALLIQYCCMYAKYLKQLTDGAEKRKRSGGVSALGLPVIPEGTSASAASPPSVVSVFGGPTDFDKMVDELINRYYIEGEHWLMRSGVKGALVAEPIDNTGLDECFFVLQRCSQRAIATNNIHAACAALHLISDMLSSDLLKQATDMLTAATVHMAPIMQETMLKYTRPGSSEVSAGSLSKNFQSAITLASAYTGQGGTGKEGEKGEEEEVERDVDDPYGLAGLLRIFNMVETCVRYTDRLNRDISRSGEAVFATPVATDVPVVAPPKGKPAPLSPEMEKLKICKEDFEAAKLAFQMALKVGVERVVAICLAIMKDVLGAMLGRAGPQGGVQFDLEEPEFLEQPGQSLLPRLLVLPFEVLVTMGVTSLTEGTKDLMVGLMADACCVVLEQYCIQTTFSWTGAMKYDECVSALKEMYNRHSSTYIRGKFPRLREIMTVLTTPPLDINNAHSFSAESFNILSNNEILAFASLRKDRKTES